MDFLQSTWMLAFVSAFVLYGSGKIESGNGARKGMLWAGLSIAASLLVIKGLGGGWPSELLAQVGVFVGIAVIRTLLDSRDSAKRSEGRRRA